MPSQKEIDEKTEAARALLENKQQLLDQCPNEKEALVELLTKVNAAKEHVVREQEFLTAANLREFERDIQIRIRKLAQPTT